MKKIVIILGSVIVFISCSSTHITSSWRAPNTDIKITDMNKVLVVALFKNKTTSHLAEDQMVRYLNGKGVVSYQYLKENFDRKNVEAIQSKIKKDNFDGAVTMRLIDVDKESRYTSSRIDTYPNYYQSFGGYYVNSMNYYNDPGYYSTTKIYTVETNVYSIKEDKIIWTGLTETTNPDGVDKMTKDIAKVVYKKMLDEGFIAK